MAAALTVKAATARTAVELTVKGVVHIHLACQFPVALVRAEVRRSRTLAVAVELRRQAGTVQALLVELAALEHRQALLELLSHMAVAAAAVRQGRVALVALVAVALVGVADRMARQAQRIPAAAGAVGTKAVAMVLLVVAVL